MKVFYHLILLNIKSQEIKYKYRIEQLYFTIFIARGMVMYIRQVPQLEKEHDFEIRSKY